MENRVRPCSAAGPQSIAPENITQHKLAATWFGALQRAELRDAEAAHAHLLGWLLTLPDGLDPATAASDILAYQAQQQHGLSVKMTELLQSVAASPLASLARRRTRRRCELH